MSSDAQQKRHVMTLTPGGSVAAIVPRSIEDAYRMAELMCVSKMAPSSLGSPEAVCVAILHGMEIGLTPMAAVQSIAVINGKPALWGDGFLAVIQASGQLEWMKEYEQEVEGKGKTAFCEMKRKGFKEPTVRTFSEVEAREAGLAGKVGPWKSYPSRMRQMRARAFCGRDAFADILKGIRSAEEAQDIIDVTPSAPKHIAPPPPEAQVVCEPEDDSLSDPQGYLSHIEEQLACVSDQPSIEEIWQAYEPNESRLPEAMQQRAAKLFADAARRVSGEE